MWGDRKKAWDIVPDMEAARARSMKQLTALATDVVRNLLGPSPQAEKEAEKDEQYALAVQHWEENQNTLNSMSREDFLAAMAKGVRPCPERKPSAPETPAELDAWLRQKISERLLSKLDSVMMDLIGIESNYGSGYRLKSNSQLGTLFAEKVRKMAIEFADKWVTENSDSAVKDMKLPELLTQYRYDLENATKKAVTERIAVVAKQRAENIRTEVLETAIDQAMFDMYPILRRMEAAERLGAKTEKDAA